MGETGRITDTEMIGALACRALDLQNAIRGLFHTLAHHSRVHLCSCGALATHDGSRKGNGNRCDACMPDYDQHDYPELPEAGILRTLARLQALPSRPAEGPR